MILSKVAPRWLGYFGIIAAVGLLMPWVEVFGLDAGALLSVSVTLVQLWFLTVGVVLLARQHSQMDSTQQEARS
jgi:hypothetical protein